MRTFLRRSVLEALSLAPVAMIGIVLLLPACVRVRDGPPRVELEMKTLGIAMHGYASDNGRLPPAALHSADGRPLLSWRVLLLPYLGEPALAKEFHLDEAWDSPHNQTLLPRMPSVYRYSGPDFEKVSPHHTLLKVLTGEGAAFEGAGLKIPDDFPDGLGKTIMMVEAGEPVPWTKPEDISYRANGPLPELFTARKGGVYTLRADGSLRRLKPGTPEATLRALITRNGHEDVKDGP